MNWLLPIIVGWCGTGWPFKCWGGRGGGGFDPDWPWPPNCWVCGGLLGAISAGIVDPMIMSQFNDAGLGGRIAVDFFAGGFGRTVIGGLYGLVGGKRNAATH